jgi:hypothetical protein
MKIVNELAKALDQDDYTLAEALLDQKAVYDSGDAVIHGASNIIASFRKTAEWGRGNLDALEFSHEIDDAAASTEIVFLDVVRKAGEELTLRHRMHVSISENRLVDRLRLERPRGERAVIRAFFLRHGLTRPGTSEWSES